MKTKGQQTPAAQGQPAASAKKLFLDCEYNGFGGPLISMALVAEDGREFYEVLSCENPVAWVAEHVMPNLNKPAVTGMVEFQNRLRLFLAQFGSIHVVADWPEDIAHLCRSLITEPGWRITTPPLTMEILQIDAESAQPHNALADARGLRDVVVQTSQVSILKGAE